MNTKILEQLTFGFEIEGVYKSGMDKVLRFQGNFVSDGSVNRLNPQWECQLIPRDYQCRNCIMDSTRRRVEIYCPEHHARYHREGSVSTEYATQIFQSLPEALDVLKKFNKKNYTWNETCGLHFHIGIKGDPQRAWRKLFATTSNAKFISELHEQALKWCDCQNKRLMNTDRNRYYMPYQNNRELILANKGNPTKYRFLNFHSKYHTLEFRFLSPCEHKVKNVNKLINTLTAYLGRTENVNRYALVSTETIRRPDMEILKLIPKAVPFNLVKKLEPGRFAAMLRGQYGRPRYGYAYTLPIDSKEMSKSKPPRFNSQAYQNELYLQEQRHRNWVSQRGVSLNEPEFDAVAEMERLAGQILGRPNAQRPTTITTSSSSFTSF